MGKIGICGHFTNTGGNYGGQTVKTNILKEALLKTYSGIHVDQVDTQEVHHNPIRFFVSCFNLIRKNDNVIILPAQLAVGILVPFFALLNIVFKKSLHYYVIGGWLETTIRNKPSLKKYLKKYMGIYVELNSMENSLQKMGFENIVYVNKFRDTIFLKEDEINTDITTPYKLCFFSRILKEKGIEDAVSAINNINSLMGRTVYTLDIYGPIDEGNYKEGFEKLKESFNDAIKYKGVIDYHNATPVLKNYFAMLFPTYYSGEGYANVIVDAFAAGLPVIATDWKYNSEVIHDGEDGIIYEYNKSNELEKTLLSIVDHPEIIITMKYNVCKRAKEYNPQNAIKPLVDRLNIPIR